MDKFDKPYRVEFKEATYQGDWTAEQIDNGEAGEPVVNTVSMWFENTPQGPQEITDEKRIKQLEDRLAR